MATENKAYWSCDWCPHGRFDTEEECVAHEIICSCAPPEMNVAQGLFNSFWGDYLGPCTTSIFRELKNIQERRDAETNIKKALILKLYEKLIRFRCANLFQAIRENHQTEAESA